MGKWLGLAGLVALASTVGGTFGCGSSGDDAGKGGSSGSRNGGAGSDGSKAGSGGVGGSLLPIAGSSSVAGTTAGGDGGSGGDSGGATVSGGAFDPDVPEEYVGKIIAPGMEVVAHTAREGVLGTEWLMAVKNTGTAYLCAIDVQFSFLDAAGTELGSGFGLLDVDLVRGCDGACGFTNCLGPGKVGMLVDTLALSDVDVSKIAKVTHEFGALILTDAAPTTEIKVTEVTKTAGEFGGNVFSGTLKNDSPEGVKNPSVNIYGVNAVGRPLFASKAIERTTIAAGGSWPFKTTGKFEEAYVSYAAYADVSDL